ncbi:MULTISPECIES: hypothetical protein [Mameliella]|uniref:hypothetical protein n=1 Tax=Mameliella TaxID=1434019 RepID=UPI000B531C6C|nr:MULTISPECIES: hypothetical protein [Mameliella]MCR9273676.1 hypothetical protein [Paracoccaceae bacterium]OWV56793.1 hypothetical protein CDZ98_17405 [Mameliella alba]
MHGRDINTHRTSLALVALVALAACGDNLGEQSEDAVALDVNVLSGSRVGVANNINYCSRYPSRC